MEKMFNVYGGEKTAYQVTISAKYTLQMEADRMFGIDPADPSIDTVDELIDRYVDALSRLPVDRRAIAAAESSVFEITRRDGEWSVRFFSPKTRDCIPVVESYLDHHIHGGVAVFHYSCNDITDDGGLLDPGAAVVRLRRTIQRRDEITRRVEYIAANDADANVYSSMMVPVEDTYPTEDTGSAPDIEETELICQSSRRIYRAANYCDGMNGVEYTFNRPITEDEFRDHCVVQGHTFVAKGAWYEQYTKLEKRDSEGMVWAFEIIDPYTD